VVGRLAQPAYDEILARLKLKLETIESGTNGTLACLIFTLGMLQCWLTRK
jgi:hypothetical protein